MSRFSVQLTGLQQRWALSSRGVTLALRVSAWAPLVVVGAIVVYLAVAAAKVDLGGLLSPAWNPALGRYGLLPFIAGSIATGVIAIAIAAPVGVLAAVFLSESVPARVARAGSVLVDLAAAMPSVVYGLWARSEIVPLVARGAQLWGDQAAEGHGFGLLSASIVLASMTTPTVCALTFAMLRALPSDLREGPMALGATRWETVRSVLLPTARRGIVGAVVLGFGRALGETIAVAMVAGGRANTTLSPLAPTATLSTLLVDEVPDATHPEHVGALAAGALVLLAMAACASLLSSRLIRQVARAGGAP
jgi:phosphate transport system permease protein